MADKNSPDKKLTPDNLTVVDISGGKKGVVSKKKDRKKEKVKKRKPKFLLPLIIILLLCALIAAFYVSTFMFDVFELRAPIFEFMHNLDPEYQELTTKRETLDVRERELNEQQQTLEATEATLEVLRLQLQQREDLVSQSEKSRAPVYRPPINEEDREYMENIGKIYSSMDAANAAEIMVNLYTIEDMAAIIYFMKNSSAAAILENMDAKIAAQITDQLLNTYT